MGRTGKAAPRAEKADPTRKVSSGKHRNRKLNQAAHNENLSISNAHPPGFVSPLVPPLSLLHLASWNEMRSANEGHQIRVVSFMSCIGHFQINRKLQRSAGKPAEMGKGAPEQGLPPIAMGLCTLGSCILETATLEDGMFG